MYHVGCKWSCFLELLLFVRLSNVIWHTYTANGVRSINFTAIHCQFHGHRNSISHRHHRNDRNHRQHQHHHHHHHHRHRLNIVTITCFHSTCAFAHNAIVRIIRVSNLFIRKCSLFQSISDESAFLLLLFQFLYRNCALSAYSAVDFVVSMECLGCSVTPVKRKTAIPSAVHLNFFSPSNKIVLNVFSGVPL